MIHRGAWRSLVQSIASTPFERPSEQGDARPVFTRVMRWLDLVLRRYNRIEEFSSAEECLIRLAVVANPREIRLSDGTELARGQPIGELHFWNEHIPPTPRTGPDVAWAITFKRRLLRSFRELAQHAEANSEAGQLEAFRAETSFGGRDGLICLSQMTDRWGFDLIERPDSRGIWQSFVHFCENCYETALIKTFNPTYAPGGRMINVSRNELWMSRRVLLARYGSTKREP